LNKPEYLNTLSEESYLPASNVPSGSHDKTLFQPLNSEAEVQLSDGVDNNKANALAIWLPRGKPDYRPDKIANNDEPPN
jgi:hypothetical protein